MSISALAREMSKISGRSADVERRNLQRWLVGKDRPYQKNRELVGKALELPPNHPLIGGGREEAVLDLLARIESRVVALETRVVHLEGEDAHQAQEDVDE